VRPLLCAASPSVFLRLRTRRWHYWTLAIAEAVTDPGTVETAQPATRGGGDWARCCGQTVGRQPQELCGLDESFLVMLARVFDQIRLLGKSFKVRLRCGTWML